MDNEIKAAVEWWAKCLDSPVNHDNGDPQQTALMSGIALMKHIPPDANQLDAFKGELSRLLRDRLIKHWHIDEPERGSYFRQIFNDYGADVILQAACAPAGIKYSMLTFPCKTRMSIDPGKVTVACGYRAAEVVIYDSTAE